MRSMGIFTGAALALSGLGSGCVIYDSKSGPEPAWWPAFVVRESTEPKLLNYTSPGPGELAVGQPPRPDDPHSPFPGVSGSRRD